MASIDSRVASNAEEPPDTRRLRHAQRRRQYPLHTEVGGVLPMAPCDVLVCVTLYNEPAAALAETLIGLAVNQRQLLQEGTRMVVCILLDGEQHLHPSTATYLGGLNLTPWRATPQTRTGPNRLYLHRGEVALSHLLGTPDDEPTRAMSLIFASKRDNGGKLDSHAWLFWGVCSQLHTRYVMQLDTGSVPQSGCISVLLAHIRREPGCAAVTPHIHIAAPRGLDPARNWQYADYLWEKVSDWAIGNAFHYLEVVPGQCSLIDRERFCSPSPGNGAALDDYLRGIEPEGLLERNLFLAEDRVLGFELVRRRTGGGIRYNHRAALRTDIAPDFAELVRQRRRWINSTLAARCNSLLQLPRILCDAALSPGRRLGILASLAWGWSNLIGQFTMPAFAALLMAVGVSHTFCSSAQSQQGLGLLAAALFMGVWAGSALLSRNVGLETRRRVFWHKATVTLLGALVITATALSLTCASAASLLLMAASVSLLGLAIALQSASERRHVLRWMPYYLLLLPAFNLYLTTYSIANLSDTSWGTKGLTLSPAHTGERRRLAIRRDLLLAAWLLASGLMAAGFLLFVPDDAWITALQFTSAFIFLRAAVAAITSLATQWRSRLARHDGPAPTQPECERHPCAAPRSRPAGYSTVAAPQPNTSSGRL